MSKDGRHPPKKDKRIEIRVDPDLYDRATERAHIFGGLSAVIRAMLKMFASGENNFDPEDLADAHRRAKKEPRKK